MSWTELLRREVESTGAGTGRLVARVQEGTLDWKPPTGSNWMTTGQLLKHLTEACGGPFRGFVAGDWGLPEGLKMEDMKPEEMLPPAEKLPAVGCVAEAIEGLRRDTGLALEMLATCSEEDLARKPAPAPWDPTPMVLGHRLLQMVEHLKLHKAQLFYYLKLQGEPVDTSDLWG